MEIFGNKNPAIGTTSYIPINISEIVARGLILNNNATTAVAREIQSIVIPTLRLAILFAEILATIDKTLPYPKL